MKDSLPYRPLFAARAGMLVTTSLKEEMQVRMTFGRPTITGGGGIVTMALAVATLMAGCGGSSSSGGASGTASSPSAGGASAGSTGIPPVRIVDTTPPARGPISSVTWDDPYGEPQSLDPLKAWALPENTVLSNLCESLVRIGPNEQVQPSLATSVHQTSPTTFVFRIRRGVKFWDGKPMTVSDVIYSLQRQLNPKNNSIYSVYTSEIKSVSQTGSSQVTVTTKTPYSLMKDVTALALGTVVEKSYAQAKGSAYGSPGGGVMCTGPFKFQSWVPGQQITMVKNPDYWNSAGAAKASTFVFKFLTNPSTVVAALQSGEIDGAFQVPTKGLNQLQSSSAGHLYFGPSMLQNVIQASATSGPAANVLVRQALSDALDRAGVAQTIFAGFAEPARWISSPWTYGDQQHAFQAAYKSLPDDSHPNYAAARKLLTQAGNPKQTLTVAALATDDASVGIATELQSAAQQIGLNMRIRELQSAAYTNSLFEPAARKGIDFIVGTGGVTEQDVPDPIEAMVFAGITGAQFNLDNYTDRRVNQLTTQALGTVSDAMRAPITIKALIRFTNAESVMPVVFTPETLFMNRRISGASTGYPSVIFYPWAAGVGAAP